MAKLFCPFLHIPGNEGVLFRFSDCRWRLAKGHRHDRLEMNLVLKGHGELLLRDRKYPLLPGHLVCLFPNQWHAPLNWSPDLEMWIVEFDPSIITRTACGDRRELRGHNPGRKYCRRVSSETLAELDRLLASVESSLLNYETFNQGLSFALYALWEAFQKSEEAGEARALPPLIAKIIDLMNYPETAETTVLEMAGRVGLAPRRISALFRREVGQTIPEYRNRIRLQRFFEKFEKEPVANLLHLALDAGFGSYAQFHRVFKHATRKSPKAWLSEK